MTELLNGYLTKLFFVSVAAVVCDLICDNSSFMGKNLTSAVRLVCSLCVCLCVFSAFLPGSELIKQFEDLQDNIQNINTSKENESSESAVIENTRKTLENNLSSAIFQNYGIKPELVCIEFSIKRYENSTEVTVSGAEIVMPPTDRQTLYSSVRIYAESVLGCEVKVTGSER